MFCLAPPRGLQELASLRLCVSASQGHDVVVLAQQILHHDRGLEELRDWKDMESFALVTSLRIVNFRTDFISTSI